MSGAMVNVERVAEACHNALREISITMGQDAPPVWEDAEAWMHETTKGVLMDLMANPTMTPRQIHDTWCLQKMADGWVYGPVKDQEKKTHPCLVPYMQLPLGERFKDVMFRMVATTHLSIMGYDLASPFEPKMEPDVKA